MRGLEELRWAAHALKVWHQDVRRRALLQHGEIPREV